MYWCWEEAHLFQLALERFYWKENHSHRLSVMVMKNVGPEKKSGSSRFDCKFCKINLPSFDIKFHVFSQLVNSIPIPGGDSAVDQLDAIPVVCIVL